MMHNRHAATRVAAAGAILVASALIVTPAQATDPVGVTVELLSNGPILFEPFNVNVAKLDQGLKWDLKLSSKGNTHVYIARNTVAAGGHLGWHSHPGPTMVSVIQGTVRLYDGTDPLCGFKDYVAGEGFTEISREHVHLLRNIGGGQAQVIAYHMVPQGEPRRIDEQKPTNCPTF